MFLMKKRKRKKELEKILDFLIEIGKLKKTKRRGWIMRKVKNPESIADHTFRTAILAWILSSFKNLNTNKIVKMALVHDLCEVEAGDTTPYDPLLRKIKNQKDLENLLKIWPKFSQKEKIKFAKEKFQKELKGLKKVLSFLPKHLQKEMINLWLEYERGITKEGRFLKQLDRIENLIQALEYLKEGNKFAISPWWEQKEELIDDPLLLEFLSVLEKKFEKIFENYK
jgi:putative hydrolase of HD superfamily